MANKSIKDSTTITNTGFDAGSKSQKFTNRRSLVLKYYSIIHFQQRTKSCVISNPSLGEGPSQTAISIPNENQTENQNGGAAAGCGFITLLIIAYNIWVLIHNHML